MEFFSPGHLIVLAIVVAVLFFGWKQLPDMARSLGRSLRVFKTEIKGMTEDDKARSEAGENTRDADSAPRAIEAARPVTAKPVVGRTDVSSGAISEDVARARPRPAPRPAANTGQSSDSRGASG